MRLRSHDTIQHLFAVGISTEIDGPVRKQYKNNIARSVIKIERKKNDDEA